MTPFLFQNPDTIDAAIALLAGAGEDTKILAGGQSLLLALKERQARPAKIISIYRLPEMNAVGTAAGGGLEIGSGLTYAALMNTEFSGWQREIAAVAGNLADRSVRNIGTIGGGVCQADPRYDMPVLLSAAAATFTLVSARGTRIVMVDAFFNQAGGTHITPDEILTVITLPPLPRWSHLVFEKFRFRTFEAAAGSVGLALAVDDAGVIADIRLSIGVVAKAPSLAAGVMARLQGKTLDGIDIDAAARAASEEVLPLASALSRQRKYQSELTVSLIKRAFGRLRQGMPG